MKQEYELKQAKFIHTKGEYGYEEIIQKLPEAKFVIIVTYNISNKREALLNLLNNIPKESKITIITNIPKRFEEYYSDRSRRAANDTINIYTSRLNPKAFNQTVESYFDFSNHGKIVLTDSIAYVGSENFSDESKNNREFGFVTEDIDFIKYIKDNMIPIIKNDSISYYNENSKSIIEAMVILAALFDNYNEIRNKVFCHEVETIEDLIYNSGKISNTIGLSLGEKALGIQTLLICEDLVRDVCKLSSKLYQEIEISNELDDDETEKLCDKLDEYKESIDLIKEKILDYSCSSEIMELAEYDNNGCEISYILNDEFAADAYEENLEMYIDEATEIYKEKVENLYQKASEELEILLDLF